MKILFLLLSLLLACPARIKADVWVIHAHVLTVDPTTNYAVLPNGVQFTLPDGVPAFETKGAVQDATNALATDLRTVLAQTNIMAANVVGLSTAAYSNSSAFATATYLVGCTNKLNTDLRAALAQTNILVSNVGNAGTAAYSNSSAFDLSGAALNATNKLNTDLRTVLAQTNILVANISDAGTASYSNANAFQPLDTDLTTIAGLTATSDNFMVAASSAWASRTPAQAKTSLALTKSDVGLGSVDNVSDAGKPVSTAQQTALDLKANLASPTFSGTPSLPTGTTATTQSASDNSTKLATTAYVDTLGALKAPLASPTFTGTVTMPASTWKSFQTATTGHATLAASTTTFITLNNSTTNGLFATDASGGTRSLVPRTTTFKNMYVVASVNPGTAKCTITLMTNGVAGGLTCGPSGGTTANDTTHSDTIAAGVEVGWKIVIASGATAAKYVIAVEADE